MGQWIVVLLIICDQLNISNLEVEHGKKKFLCFTVTLCTVGHFTVSHLFLSVSQVGEWSRSLVEDNNKFSHTTSGEG